MAEVGRKGKDRSRARDKARPGPRARGKDKAESTRQEQG
jgi:hypothetical protein